MLSTGIIAQFEMRRSTRWRLEGGANSEGLAPEGKVFAGGGTYGGGIFSGLVTAGKMFRFAPVTGGTTAEDVAGVPPVYGGGAGEEEEPSLTYGGGVATGVLLFAGTSSPLATVPLAPCYPPPSPLLPSP